MGAKRREVWVRRLGIAYRIGLALIIFVAVTLKALIEYAGWTPPKWVLPTLVAVAALAALRDHASAAFRKYKAPGRRARHADIQLALVAALGQIADRKKVPLEELGASVFVIRRGAVFLPRGLRERWKWSRPHLERLIRFRLTDNPQPSDVRWECGKGTIGQCWKLDKPTYTYWLPIALRHGKGELSVEAFGKLPEPTRMNLSREEFNSIVNKYAEIRAVPLKESGGRIVGVVSVDLALKNRTKSDQQVLNSKEIEDYITTAAAVIQKNR